MDENQKTIYIIISQSGTLPSRFLCRMTGAAYNHVSISLQADLKRMYSFGRRYKYYPFWGGFVAESPTKGTFGRFPETKVKVLALAVTDEQFDAISGTIDEMLRKRKKYHYDYLGVGLAYFKIPHQSEYSSYCSEFVKKLLKSHGVQVASALPEVAQPIHFLDLPGVELVYTGRLLDYVI